MEKIYKKGFQAPLLDLERDMCAKYARVSASIMSGGFHLPANAWDFYKKNNLVLETDNYGLKHSLDFLFPRETIIIFANPESRYNRPERIGTHAMIYLGKQQQDLWFAEQRGTQQQIISLSDITAQGLDTRQVFNSLRREN